MKLQDALDQLARETRRVQRRLAFERGVALARAPLLAASVWAGVALFGAHEALPFLAQSLTALAALVLVAALAWRALRRWTPPTRFEARARLADDSRFDAASLAALDDQPVRLDARASAFWKHERTRALELAGKARAGPPRLHLNALDPYRLRYAAGFALVVGVIVAGWDAPDRLARAFFPDPGPLVGDRPMQIEAWATPADYLRAAPISLSDSAGGAVVTPPAVDVTVRLTGPAGPPSLTFDGRRAHARVRFERSADGAWEARLPVSEAGRLRIVRFHTRAAWRFAPSPDRAPRAAFTAPIAQLADETVSIAWRAEDDFGVRRLALRVRPVTPPPGLRRADPVDTDLEAPAGDPREAQTETEIDLAAHPYAGMEVEARIVAFDAIGQEGVSEPLRFTMPEKVFLQPLARAAIEIRRHLMAERRPYRAQQRRQPVWRPAGDILFGNQREEVRDAERTPSLRRAPEGVRHAARLINALTMAPEDGYFRDLAVYLGFQRARAQLDLARNISETDAAADMLWHTALRAEYGGAADTRRALEEAQRQLAQALAEGAPPERIRQLVDALRRATEAYMQALVQEALRDGDRDSMEDTLDQTEVSEQDIEQMMREVQRLAEQGRQAEAQALLDQLAGILQNLDVRLSEQQSGEGDAQEQPMQQSLDNLAQTMGEQRALRDDTQRQQQGQGGGGGEQRGGQGGDPLAERQAALRQGLADAQRMAEEAGSAPSDDLNAAGEAMRRSEDALRRGDLQSAQAAQSAALNDLRSGADALAAEMRARGEEGQDGEALDGSNSGRDPLGRSTGNGRSDSSTTGSHADPVRARDVYDEIRRRAEDPTRPDSERDYLRRLLDRFGDS